MIYSVEAGDAVIDQQNSQIHGKHTEWLCMGGYLVTKDHDNNLRSVCDELAELIGSQTGQTLHFRNYSNKKVENMRVSRNENRESIRSLLLQRHFAKLR